MIEKLQPEQENVPSTVQLKRMNCQEMKGKAQPPADRKIIAAFSIQAKPTWPTGGPTASKPKQNHSPEKPIPKGKKAPIFGIIGKGFEFALTTRQQRLFTAWMKGQQVRDSTQEKHPLQFKTC